MRGGNAFNEVPDPGTAARLLSRVCISPAPGFAFGHLLFDEDVIPGLDLLFPTFEVKRPVRLHLDADGGLTIGWADGTCTDVGCMHRAMVKACRRHRQVDVAIGIRGSRRALKLVIEVG